MKRGLLTTATVFAVLSIICVAPALADDYDIDWYTFDGGGDVFTSGADFELSGTIGQPDAGLMSGGNFTLTGGFWAVLAAGPQYSLGDLNCDGVLNAFDIDPFVLALTNPGAYQAAYPECDINLADINGDGVINAFDIDPFVDLLTGD